MRPDSVGLIKIVHEFNLNLISYTAEMKSTCQLLAKVCAEVLTNRSED